MKIAIDAFGGDNAPFEIIKGASMAQKEIGVDIILTGDENVIKKCITDNNIEFGNLEIIHTTDVISMHDEPTSLIKAHKESSMALAFKALAEGNADAFVSAGSTGAIVVGGTLIVKRIKGVKRPALASFVPSANGNYMLLDMGANADCRPEMLCQFGVMASCYLENVTGIKNPKIALLNIGTEDSKGDEVHKEAYKLLENAPINFAGNIEARDLPKCEYDAVVADGFSGNIALKLMEGTISTFFKMLKQVFYKNIFTKIATLFLKNGLYGLKEKMDASEIGGALLLGVSKPVIKAHGSSDAKAIKNAIIQAKLLTEANVVNTIAENLKTEVE